MGFTESFSVQLFFDASMVNRCKEMLFHFLGQEMVLVVERPYILVQNQIKAFLADSQQLHRGHAGATKLVLRRPVRTRSQQH